MGNSIMYLPISIIVLLSVCGTSYADVAWVNLRGAPVNFKCPPGKYINEIQSPAGDRYGIGTSDRAWAFGCGSDLSLTGSCNWTPGYVNELGEKLGFKCKNSGVITGIASDFNKAKKDRQYKFRCCDVQKPALKCEWPRYMNMFNGEIDFKVPKNYGINGLYSVHVYTYGDRMWRAHICDFNKEIQIN